VGKLEYLSEPVRYFGYKPKRQREGDSGYDLSSAEPHVICIEPGERDFVRTGTWLAIPRGHVGLIAPRSGLAINHGITVLNAPGVIDPDYRGEIKVILYNAGDEPYIVATGDRIAQLLIVKLAMVTLEPHPDLALDETERGSDGFGSTGYGDEAA
jgi:dUTP pyrophosphatase